MSEPSEETLVVAPQHVVFAPGRDEVTVYANLAQVLFSAEDVCIYFAVRNPHKPDEAIGVARVYCGHPHFKRLATVMAGQIEAFEATLGQIDADPASRLAPESADAKAQLRARLTEALERLDRMSEDEH